MIRPWCQEPPCTLDATEARKLVTRQGHCSVCWLQALGYASLSELVNHLHTSKEIIIPLALSLLQTPLKEASAYLQNAFPENSVLRARLQVRNLHPSRLLWRGRNRLVLFFSTGETDFFLSFPQQIVLSLFSEVSMAMWKENHTVIVLNNTARQATEYILIFVICVLCLFI